MLNNSPGWTDIPTEVSAQLGAFVCKYQSAIREVKTKLENLDEDFKILHQRNPINHMKSRMKSYRSICEKLERKGYPVSLESAEENLTDIAGIRVICSYIEDIYMIADLLTQQDDVTLLRSRDYIKDPKPNGYRSLHLIISIPVFLREGKIPVPVEVQIRTIAMDFWASLEHHIHYKGTAEIPDDIANELSCAAQDIAQLDLKMQSIYNKVNNL